MKELLESYQTAYNQLCLRRDSLRHAMRLPAINRKEYDDLDQRQQLLAEECSDLLFQMNCLLQYPNLGTGGMTYVKI